MTTPPARSPAVLGRAEQRFRAVYDAHATRVLAYALRHTDRDAAHDVTADVFLVAWRRLDELPAEPLPWLLVVARNTLANRRRAHRRRGALESRLADLAAGVTGPASAASPAAEDVAVERTTMLHALAELTGLEREAVLLVSWDGLSPHDAATVAGCSRDAFAARLHRARLRLERACSADPPDRPTDPAPLPALREARA